MKLGRITLDKLANVTLIAAALTFIFLSFKGYYRWGGPGQEPVPAVTPEPPEAVEGLTLTDLDGVATASSGTPKVALVEFSDFQCPFCSRHARNILPQIRRDFVDTGKVQYAFVNLPLQDLHPLAYRASEAVECARRQGRFWAMHDRLFQDPPALAEPDLLEDARALGLDSEEFRACLGGEARTALEAQAALAQRAGVASTPSFLIGRIEPPGSLRVLYRLRGTRPYPMLEDVLEHVLASD